ncbi:barley B recombinant-like protein D [Tasmannia lanceolata]|uniref:barley B recombinant-like protein D n=1 Tax=Tasmannia lanceolata TaxID=3420 RepID=UPI0040641B42
MDDNVQRDNGRHKSDHYKGIHSQWIIPPQMKDHQTIKLMAVMAERDAAIQERNLALSEKKAALAERDMAMLQRDTAIAERNNAMMERDSAISALEYARDNAMNGGGVATCPPGCGVSRGTKHIHHPPHIHHPSHMGDAPYHTREMHIISEAFPISAVSEASPKSRKAKRPRKESKALLSSKKASKPVRKGKRTTGEDLNKQFPEAKQLEWKNSQFTDGEDLNKQSIIKHEWKDQDLGLNQVTFDDSTMPIPVCSCTGALQQCYKWGNGGWQSACCTTTMSMHPLPVMPNKRHARVGGRKMSGSVFTRLISRLAAEGHDLTTPLDLKDHWAKHGTNRYITIK